MTLKKMVPCPHHGTGFLAELHPQYTQYPSWCPNCRGKLEYEKNVYFENIDEPMAPINYEEISDIESDLWCRFTCKCGDTVSFSESGDVLICSCGRAYRLNMSIDTNADHVGDTQYWIDRSNKS